LNLSSWDVAGENPAAGAYRIKIILSGDPSFTDLSNDVFYLTNLSVDGPTGGAYGAGGSCPISWSTDASSGTVRIELMSDSSSSVVATIAEGVSIAGGSYPWTIGGSISGSYSIRLVREDLESIKAQGGVFTVINGITVTSPNNADRIAGSSLPISWSCPSGGSVKIELLESGSVSTTISSSTTNDGNYSYSLPTTQLPDTAYSVRVTTLTSPAFSDTSSSFRILPPTPTIGSASDASSTAYISVTWSLVSGNPSYRIYRATSATGTYSLIDTVSGTTNYNDASATPGTRYYYKIAALRNGVEGNLSNWDDGVRDIVAPSLSTSGNTSRVYLDWNDITGRTEYRVYRSTSSTTGYSQIGTASSSYYYDYSATPGQRYYYKVAAYNPNTGESLSSYAEGHRSLAQVTGLTTVSHEGYHVLSWSSVSGAVSGYRIYRREYSETNGSWGSWAAEATTGATSRNMYPSVIGKVYAYAVAAYNSVTGEYAWSDTVYGHAKLWPPTEFTAVSSGLGANTLSWYGEGAATGGYEIQAYSIATNWQTQTTVPQDTYSYTDTFNYKLPSYKPSFYRIRCVYDSYWDDYSGSLVIYNTTSDWLTISAP
jgi:hypothetical protein